MRICIIDNKEVKLSTNEWLSKGRPEVIGCSDLRTQAPFKRIDWSQDVGDIKRMLSKDQYLVGQLSDYICLIQKQSKYYHGNYSANFKLINLLLDHAFNCGWVEGLGKLQEQVDEVVAEDPEAITNEEELDAVEDIELDLNKLKFNTNGQASTKETNQRSENFGREEDRVVQEVGHSESERSNRVLQSKAKASTKKKGRKRS